ncbi:hypothetical protein VPH35_122949 [Triticum aestivum]
MGQWYSADPQPQDESIDRAGRGAEERIHGGRHGDHDVHQPGVRRAGVPPGPLPGELPGGRGHGAPAGPRPHRGRRPRRAPAVPVGAPALLPPPSLPGRRGLQRREALHDQGLPGHDVGQEPVPADHPRARLQLPLHGHRHHVVPEPAAAHRHHVGRGHRERLLQRGPGEHGEPAQRRVPVREVGEPDAGVLPAVAARAAQVPGGDQRAGDPGAGAEGAEPALRRADAVPGHGALRRLLPAERRHGQGVHAARQLLHRPRQQGARPQERAQGLEELHGGAARGPARGRLPVDQARQVHPLTELAPHQRLLE